MDSATKSLVKCAKEKGVSVSAIVNGIGSTRNKIYPSFSGSRPLRADEFLDICHFLGVNPMELRDDTKQAG